MRGYLDPQASMFSYFSPEARVPAAHPLRSIKGYADTALKSLSRDFDELYACTGRPSIPPERLLKASLLIALYSVRSDRLFCEMLDYNILFRWFLDMSLEERGLDQSNFSRLRERLLESKVAGRFFDAVVGETRKLDLLSDEHFTVDGTLIEPGPRQRRACAARTGHRMPPDPTIKAWSTSAANAAPTPPIPRPPIRIPSSCAKARAKNPSSATVVSAQGESPRSVRGPQDHCGCGHRDRSRQGHAGPATPQANPAQYAGRRQGLSQQGFRGASASAQDRPAPRDD